MAPVSASRRAIVTALLERRRAQRRDALDGRGPGAERAIGVQRREHPPAVEDRTSGDTRRACAGCTDLEAKGSNAGTRVPSQPRDDRTAGDARPGGAPPVDA